MHIGRNNTALAIVCTILLASTSHAQTNNNDHWEAYLAAYDHDSVGSTLVNFSLHDEAPVKGYPFIVITGVTFKNCSTQGMPVESEFDKLNAVSDSVLACLGSINKIIHAGTFTYQCQRLDYIYLIDTLGVRERLENMYKKRFKQYVSYVHIKADANWEAYTTFLYPNQVTLEEIYNTPVLQKLQQAGDKLIKPRMVDHWIYFKTDADRETFIAYAKKERFTINDKDGKKEDFTFGLHISRMDKVNLGSIDAITLALRKEAKKDNGDYDGWEAFVVKD